MSADTEALFEFCNWLCLNVLFSVYTSPGADNALWVKIIGIFLGIIYLWTTEDILWSSILGLVAMVCLGIFTGTALTQAAFGQSLLIMMLFTLGCYLLYG